MDSAEVGEKALSSLKNLLTLFVWICFFCGKCREGDVLFCFVLQGE